MLDQYIGITWHTHEHIVKMSGPVRALLLGLLWPAGMLASGSQSHDMLLVDWLAG